MNTKTPKRREPIDTARQRRRAQGSTTRQDHENPDKIVLKLLCVDSSMGLQFLGDETLTPNQRTRNGNALKHMPALIINKGFINERKANEKVNRKQE